MFYKIQLKLEMILDYLVNHLLTGKVHHQVKVGVEVINLKKLASELDSEALVEEESIKDLEYLKGVQEQEFTEAIETLKAAIQEKDEYLSKV